MQNNAENQNNEAHTHSILHLLDSTQLIISGMPGRNKCSHRIDQECEDDNPCSHYMFLAKGMFLRRTFIDEQLSANLPSTCQKLASLKNMTGQIALCQPCCETLLRGKESSDHFLGYLTKKENTEYRKYARNAEKLHSDGYLVVDRRDFGGCNFPLDQFPQVCNSSKGNI